MFEEQTPEPGAYAFPGSVASSSTVTDSRSATGSNGTSDASWANRNPVAPLVPAAPQFYSRREMRDAEAAARGRAAAASVAPAPAPEPLALATPVAVPTPRTRRVGKRPSRTARAYDRRLPAPSPSPARSAPAKAAPARKQNPALVVFVVLVVSGFIGGVALPAYAFTPGSLTGQPAASTGAHHLQALSVKSDVTTGTVTRASVNATSDAEYRAQQISAAELAAYRSGPKQAGDDYPWRLASSGLSPLGYYYRQCVDFVAWRINRDQGVTAAPWKWTWHNLTPNGGDASQWKANWEAHGWVTSAIPVVGSVAWFAGNHVAYVKSYDSVNVTIEEYNGISTRAYALRTIPISTVARFLYPPPA